MGAIAPLGGPPDGFFGNLLRGWITRATRATDFFRLDITSSPRLCASTKHAGLPVVTDHLLLSTSLDMQSCCSPDPPPLIQGLEGTRPQGLRGPVASSYTARPPCGGSWQFESSYLRRSHTSRGSFCTSPGTCCSRTGCEMGSSQTRAGRFASTSRGTGYLTCQDPWHAATTLRRSRFRTCAPEGGAGVALARDVSMQQHCAT